MIKEHLIYLHIGLHKTGTSSIQRFLFENSDNLKNEGYLYYSDFLPDFRIQHSAIALELNKGGVNKAEEYLNEIFVEAEKSNCKNIIISGEEFSVLTKESVEKLSSILQKKNVVVILYVRNMYDWALSWLNQVSKRSDKMPSIQNASDMLKGIKLDQRLQLWEDSFGAENVRIESFDRACSGKGVNQSFLETIGYSGPVTDVPEHQNLSFDAITSQLLNCLSYEFTDEVGADVYNLYRKNTFNWIKTPKIRSYYQNILRPIVRNQKLSNPKLLMYKNELFEEPKQLSPQNPENKLLYLRNLTELCLNLMILETNKFNSNRKIKDIRTASEKAKKLIKKFD